MYRPRALALFTLLVLSGCEGSGTMLMNLIPGGSNNSGDPTAPSNPADPNNPVTPDVPKPIFVPEIGMRRLSRSEIAASLTELLGVSATETFTLLPEDNGKPYDNDYTQQLASAVFVEGADTLATTVAERALADPTAHAKLVTCTPTAPDDAVCLRTFITSFGRLALRRPLREDEILDLLGTASFAKTSGKFDTAVELVIRSLLTDVEFLFRVELGTPVAGKPNTFQLSPDELASRLSFALWGRTPPAWLLDLADEGQLATADQIRAAAAKLIADPRGQANLERFHALWLGYASLPYSADLNAAFVTETNTLIDKVVFSDKSDYFNVFTSPQTWANDLLIAQYGLTATPDGTSKWVSYAGTRRKGILSHGALLSNGAKQLDTSPTRRGRWVRERLFCQNIPPPPPNVMVTDPPPTGTNGSDCKKDRYAIHDSVGSCAQCHQNMDPVGFGLENYDIQGKWRTVEALDPACTISGDGNVNGVGTFNGADGLADLLVNSGALEPCVVRQIFRFSMGRMETDADQGLLDALTAQFKSDGRKFDSLLLDFVSDPTFSQRVEASN